MLAQIRKARIVQTLTRERASTGTPVSRGGSTEVPIVSGSLELSSAALGSSPVPLRAVPLRAVLTTAPVSGGLSASTVKGPGLKVDSRGQCPGKAESADNEAEDPKQMIPRWQNVSKQGAWLAPALIAALAGCRTHSEKLDHGSALSRTTVQGSLICAESGAPIHPRDSVFIVDLTQDLLNTGPADIITIVHQGKGLSSSRLTASGGTKLRFDNRDKIFHSFFSSSPGNEFDLGPLDPGNSAFQQIGSSGFMHIYCSLHDDEKTSILVLPSPTYARVTSHGSFDLPGLLPGKHVLEVWSATRPRERVEVYVTADNMQAITFPVSPTSHAKAGR